MFKLRTGTPGSGKTLSVIDELRKITDRTIYYGNIDGLSPDLGWIEIPENQISDYHQHIPQGAIFVLDEAQKYFPVRSPSAPVPPSISHLETHRHEGQDIIFITQHPSLIDHHARRLIGEHVHLQRNFGMPFSTLYRGNELFDVKNYFELEKCEKTQYRHPKDVFSLYKSAEVHTVKARIPVKLLLVIPLIFLIVGLVFWFKHTLFGKEPVQAPAVSSSSVSSGVATAAFQGQPMSTPEQLAEAMTPVVVGLPWSAPIYRDLAKPVSMPIVVGCIKSTKPDDHRCACYTQQATLVDMPPDICAMYVDRRAFNHFRPDRQTGGQNVAMLDDGSSTIKPALR